MSSAASRILLSRRGVILFMNATICASGLVHGYSLGKPVWIGQISRDIGIRPSMGTWNLSTHAVDPVVDDARNYLLMDFMSVQGLAKYGAVKGVGEATPENPREILLGDPTGQTDFAW